MEWAQTTVDMITREFGCLEGRPRAVAVQMDVTKPEECKRTVELALERFGRLDILVNNVGIGGTTGTAVDVDVGEWKKGMDVNVLGMVPSMMQQLVNHPRVNQVDLSSVAGVVTGAAHTPPSLAEAAKSIFKIPHIFEGQPVSSCAALGAY